MEQPKPGRTDRIMDAFIGAWMIVLGCAILAGLSLLGLLKPQDIWHAAGVALGTLLYTIVGELFILEGLTKLAGPSQRLCTLKERSGCMLFAGLLATAVLIVGLAIFLAW